MYKFVFMDGDLEVLKAESQEQGMVDYLYSTFVDSFVTDHPAGIKQFALSHAHDRSYGRFTYFQLEDDSNYSFITYFGEEPEWIVDQVSE